MCRLSSLTSLERSQNAFANEEIHGRTALKYENRCTEQYAQPNYVHWGD